MNDVDPDEARRRILEELSKGEYHRRGSIIDWLLGLLQDWVSSLVDGAGSGRTAGLAIAIALGAVIVVLAVLVLRRTGRIRRRAVVRAETALDAEPALTAAQLRVCAEHARDDARADEAVVLAFRALVRDLAERTLLDLTDGMTAHEAAEGAASAFPELRHRLALAARAFDTAAYSWRPATAKQADDAVRLAEYVAQASPDRAVLETL